MRPEDALFQSPFATADGLMNSGLAMVANIGTDFYVDNVYEGRMLKNAGLMGRQKAIFDSLSYDDMLDTTGNGGNQRLRNEILGEVRAERAGGRGRYGKGTFTRRALKQAPGKESMRWWHKIFSGVRSTEEIGAQKAIRKLGGEIGKGKTARAQGIIKELVDSGRGDLVDSLKNANKLRSLGIAAIGLGFAQVGFEIGAGVTNSLASVGRRSRNLNRTAMVQSGFQDSNMAYTTRQRAMRAIQLGQSGMKRAIGNEAQFLHTYH